MLLPLTYSKIWTEAPHEDRSCTKAASLVTLSGAMSDARAGLIGLHGQTVARSCAPSRSGRRCARRSTRRGRESCGDEVELALRRRSTRRGEDDAALPVVTKLASVVKLDDGRRAAGEQRGPVKCPPTSTREPLVAMGGRLPCPA